MALAVSFFLHNFSAQLTSQFHMTLCISVCIPAVLQEVATLTNAVKLPDLDVPLD